MDTEDTQVGDDTSVEETADDSASTEETDSSSADTAKDDTDYKQLADNYKIRAEKAERQLKDKKSSTPPKEDDDFNTKLQQALDKRDLDEMEYPDDIKKAIKRVAELDKVGVKKAASDPTIQARIEAWKKDQDAEEAAIKRNNKSGGKAKFDPDSPPEVDLSTPEGRKEYDDFMEKSIQHELKNKG